MSRNTHDMDADHHGTAPAERIADGTPTAGYIPVAAGPGQPASWTAATAPIHLEDDDLTFVAPGVVFKDGAEFLGAEGSTSTVRATLRLGGYVATLGARSSANDIGYVEVSANVITIGAEDATNLSEILVTPTTIEVTAEQDVDMSGSGGLLFIPQHTSDPTGADGGMYYNTATKRVRQYDGTAWRDAGIGVKAEISTGFDGGGSVLAVGQKVRLPVEFDCTIVGWVLLADQSGDVELDILKDPYASYAPSGTTSIVASAPPEISGANKNRSSTLTGWTTAVSAGDVLVLDVVSATAITNLSVTLIVERKS